ncbi:hypothetical protein IJ579_00455 [bacterium]|nr:hypothetical protein [bacterium]
MTPEFLNSVWQIYYYVACFATILFIIKLIIFMFIGGDTEVTTDFNTEFETETSFDFLSLQSVLAFFMGFGWMGYAGLRQLAISQILTLVCAFFVGLIFMFGSAYLMFSVKKLEKNVKKDKKTAIGHTGKSYTNFEPNGSGQVEIEINGQLTVANAVNTQDCTIAAFDLIEVIKVENEVLHIRKKG